MLEVVFATLRNEVEVLVASKHRSAKPDGVFLHNILLHNATHCVISSGDPVIDRHSLVKNFLHLILKASVEALEKSRATG